MRRLCDLPSQKPKPAPDIFLEAARQLGVDPSLCLAFEDANLGVQAAEAAGMRVVDVRTISRGRVAGDSC